MNGQQAIIDANYTLDQALQGTEAPYAITKNLRLIDVQYFSFDGKLHQGQLIIHKNLLVDIEKIFNLIKLSKFPIAKVIPIVKYQWQDSLSMADNNSSAFNYRVMANSSKLSYHAHGVAIDFNPVQNPYIKGTNTQPAGATYDMEKKGTLTKQSPVYLLFKKMGWEWGGDWQTLKDYQHFEKPSIL